AVVNSWGTDYGMTGLGSFNAPWGKFCYLPILIDFFFLNKNLFTYSDLAGSGADVLIISEAWTSGVWWGSNKVEGGGVKQYVEEGHGLVATSGSLDTYSAPNNSLHLAPLLGLDSARSYTWTAPFQNVGFVQSSHPILNGMSQPYIAGDAITATPTSDHNWSQ